MADGVVTEIPPRKIGHAIIEPGGPQCAGHGVRRAGGEPDLRGATELGVGGDPAGRVEIDQQAGPDKTVAWCAAGTKNAGATHGS